MWVITRPWLYYNDNRARYTKTTGLEYLCADRYLLLYMNIDYDLSYIRLATDTPYLFHVLAGNI